MLSTEEAQQAQSDEILTVRQLAKRLKVAEGTIYNRIGDWTREDGVFHLSARCTRIHWPTFLRRLLEGKIHTRPRE